jgi:hypothetical protein
MKLYLETIAHDIGFAGIQPVISVPNNIKLVYQRYFSY